MSDPRVGSGPGQDDGPGTLPADEAEEIDRLCDRFEAAWRAGGRPRFEDHLVGDGGPFRAALRDELIAVELEWRRRAGDVPGPAGRRERSPDGDDRAGPPAADIRTEQTATAGAFPASHPEPTEHAGARPPATVVDAPGRPQGDPAPTLRIGDGTSPGVATPRRDAGAVPPPTDEAPRRDNPSGETVAVDGEAEARPSARGVLVPGYDVLEELGRGGMGVVYKARQANLNRVVALKMILAGSHADTATVSRFLREAEAIARLKHPHVVQVYDYGTHEGKPFFSLEFLEGGSLADRLRGEPQRPSEAAEIVRALAEAVQAAHDRGIVHRDLKPANVLLDAHGTPKIADFGIAKQDDSVMTVTGEVLGTPSYMSPEQAGGETKRVGPATDVYALGAILYELLTGRPPFKGASAFETIQLVRTTEPVGPHQLQPRLPLDLETICLKCLQKEPARRYASAHDLAEDLRRFLAGETILARPVGSLAKAGRWCRRNKAVAASLAAVAFSLLVATAVSVAFGLRAERAREAEADRTAGETRAKLDAQGARRDAQRQLIDITAESGLTAASEGDHTLALLWFARAAGLAGDFPEKQELNRLRYTNWLRHVWTPEGTFSVPGFRREQDRYRAFRFSPDGRYLLARTSAGGSMVWDRLQGRVVPLPVPEAQRSAAAWEPKTGSLAVGGKDGKVRLLAPPAFETVEEIPAEGEVDVLEFSRDGHRLAWVGAEGARVWDREKKAPSTPFLLHGGPVVTLAFSAGGGLLATSARDGKARVFRSASASPHALFAPVPHVLAEYFISHGGPDRVAPRFADGDRSLLTVEGNGNVYDLVWRSAETGEVRPHGGAPEGVDYLSAFDVDPGGRLIAVGWTNLGRLVDAHARGVLAAIPTEDVEDYKLCEDVVFSADGRTVATCGHDMKVKTFSLEQGRNLELKAASIPVRLPHQAVRVALTPDGRHIAAALWDGSVCLWRAPEGPPSAYSIDAGGPTWPALSADRRLVLPRGTSFRGGTLTETRIFDADTGKPVGPPMAPGGIVIDAAFRPDGARVAIAALTALTPEQRNRQVFLGEGKAGNLQVWDPKLGTRLVGPVPMPAEPRGLAYRPDGRTLAVVCANYRVVLVDADSGAIRHDLGPGVRSHFVNANLWLANGETRFSPDGRYLLTWEMAPTLHIWDPDTGRLLHALEHTERVEQVAFSPADPRILATGGRDSVVKVWDVADGRLLARLPHPRWIQSIGFSPDGAELVTGCDDGLIRAWDWQAGRLKQGVPCHASSSNLDFTAGRRRLAGQGVHFLQVFDWPTGTPISPEWRLPGEAHWGLVIPAGDRRAIVGGFDGNLVGYDLEAITTPSPLSVEELTAYAEVVAGRRVLSGGNVVTIDSAEWQERWAKLQGAAHAVSPGTPPDGGSAR